MSEVFQTNLHKLKFVYLLTALLLGVATAVILVVAYNENQFPHSKLLLQIAFGSLLALPLLVCAISLFGWFMVHNRQQKFYKMVKTSHLIPLGFAPIIINNLNKWKFSDIVYQMENTPWKIILRQNKQKKSEVEFCFYQADDFAENLIEREVKMTKKDFLRMTSDKIKSVILNTSLS